MAQQAEGGDKWEIIELPAIAREDDILGRAAHAPIDIAALNDMGGEGQFVVHVMQYIMQSTDPQDLRNDWEA